MSSRSLFLAGALLGVLGCAALAQTAPVKDAVITAAVSAVSAENIEATVRRLAAFGTRHTLSDTQSEVRGIGAARRWLKAEMERISAATGGRLQVAFESYPVPARATRAPDGVAVVNVVATLPGSEEGRYVIVSGHYDSMPSKVMDAVSDAPGANDDASGTALVLEAARVLGGLRPRATILFMAVAGEEQGLFGADGHARMAKAEKRRIAAMITNDIVGGVVGSSGKREPWRVRLFSEGIPSGPVSARGRPPRLVGSDNDAPSRQLARYLELRGEAYVENWDVTLIFRQDRYGRGGDHIPFNREGFPAVRFTEPHENFDWQHQDVREEDGRRYGDLPENLDYEFVRRVCQTNVAGIAELALAPAAPRNVRLIRALSPDSELRWNAVDAEDLGGYAVLYRRTHDPTWTDRVVVAPDQTAAVLEGISRDDFNFAVESFDARGHRSLAVYPLPATR